jgi:Putative antitoxin of bacterial toxin-antitoxin system, YdaS/YdaT
MVDAVCRGDKTIPAGWCPIVERITTGGIRAEQLRPDLAWARVESPDWPVPEGKPLLDVAPAAERSGM